MLEVLIALVVLSVGLLGIAGMIAFSLKSNDSAYMRTQAQFLAYNIIDRMRANQTAALNGNYNIAFGATISSPPNCLSAANTCTPAQIAQYDLNQWKQTLTSSTDGMPCGDGNVTLNTVGGISQITVQVEWDDSRATFGSGVNSGSTIGNACAAQNMLIFTTTSVL